jgi:hypothetical protein
VEYLDRCVWQTLRENAGNREEFILRSRVILRNRQRKEENMAKDEISATYP